MPLGQRRQPTRLGAVRPASDFRHRRAELFTASAAAQRSTHEAEQRERAALEAEFIFYRRDLLQLAARRADMADASERRRLAAADVQQRKATLQLPREVNTERERRSAVATAEARRRAAIVRLATFEATRAAAPELLRRTVRAEERTRQLMERDEAAARDGLWAGHGLLTARPPLDVFGACPFKRPTDCPFHPAHRHVVGQARPVVSGEHYAM